MDAARRRQLIERLDADEFEKLVRRPILNRPAGRIGPPQDLALNGVPRLVRSANVAFRRLRKYRRQPAQFAVRDKIANVRCPPGDTELELRGRNRCGIYVFRLRKRLRRYDFSW